MKPIFPQVGHRLPLLQWIVESYRRHQEKVSLYFLEVDGQKIILGSEKDFHIEAKNGDKIALTIEKTLEN